MKKARNNLIAVMFGVISTLGLTRIGAQPNAPAATAPTAACYTTDQNWALNDTLVAAPDAEGYTSLFNGTDFTGWWLSGLTAHGGCGNGGAVFRVSTAEKAIYSTQNGTTGGVLMTKKKFGNYEIVFDFWPDYGNDGGIFNRSPASGSCFQTVLDYLGGASVGGTWGERNPPFGSRNFKPFSYNGNENTISVDVNPTYGWTNFTNRDPNKATYGCPNGCLAADWPRLWDVNNWNEFRIQFYGGLTAVSLPVRMKSWFRKIGSANWVPIIADTTVSTPLVANYIGLQVHGGGAFGAARGNWYRNIRYRVMSDGGIPVAIPSVKSNGQVNFDISLASDVLVGELKSKHEITVQDLQGKILEKFSGPAGKFSYSFLSPSSGWLSLKIKTAGGTEYRKLHREPQPF